MICLDSLSVPQIEDSRWQDARARYQELLTFLKSAAFSYESFGTAIKREGLDPHVRFCVFCFSSNSCKRCSWGKVFGDCHDETSDWRILKKLTKNRAGKEELRRHLKMTIHNLDTILNYEF